MRRFIGRLGLGMLVASLVIVIPSGTERAAAAGGVVMYIDSQPGDELGGGIQRVLTEGGITVRENGGAAVDGTALGAGSETWDVRFAAPVGQVLGAGTTYANVTATETAGHGAMYIESASAAGVCAPGPGSWFTVHVFTDSTFAATFEYRCASASGSMFGYFGDADAAVAVIALVASPTDVSFPATAVGQTAGPVAVTLASEGSLAAGIASVSITGTGVADVSILEEDCTGALDPGGSCTVTLSFHPTISGEIRANLVIDDDTTQGSRTIPLAGRGTAPSSSVTWGSIRATKPTYAWSWHNGLARTATAETSYLHSVATTDRIGNTWADDNGPYLGVVYTRGNAGGSEWNTPKRLNSTSHHGDRASIAASGRYVYAVWARIGRYVHYNPAAPRVLYFRRNTNHGGGSAWSSALKLTSTSGRVDFPAVAASGSNVYVVWTDADAGAIRLAISRDRGATWTKSTIGSTTRLGIEGFAAIPSIAASGSQVIVSWLSNPSKDVRARVSTNSGATFSTGATLGDDATGTPSVAARGSVLALAWTAADGARVRTWTSGSWSPTRKVGAPYGTVDQYRVHLAAAVAIGTGGQVGVAWSACHVGCDFAGDTRTYVVWAESRNGGVTWYRGQVVGTITGERLQNDAPAVVWPSAGRRFVLWNGYTIGEPDYRMYLRSGTGTN